MSELRKKFYKTHGKGKFHMALPFINALNSPLAELLHVFSAQNRKREKLPFAFAIVVYLIAAPLSYLLFRL